MSTKSLTIAAALAFFLGPASLIQAQQPRSRISLNADWRFQKGDPSGKDGQLSYERVKPWVIASGNEFVKGERKPAPPSGNLGDEIEYAQPQFDDHAWRQLSLPHDWGIEGPFKQEFP